MFTKRVAESRRALRLQLLRGFFVNLTSLWHRVWGISSASLNLWPSGFSDVMGKPLQLCTLRLGESQLSTNRRTRESTYLLWVDSSLTREQIWLFWQPSCLVFR